MHPPAQNRVNAAFMDIWNLLKPAKFNKQYQTKVRAVVLRCHQALTDPAGWSFSLLVEALHIFIFYFCLSFSLACYFHFSLLCFLFCSVVMLTETRPCLSQRIVSEMCPGGTSQYNALLFFRIHFQWSGLIKGIQGSKTVPWMTLYKILLSSLSTSCCGPRLWHWALQKSGANCCRPNIDTGKGIPLL